MKNKSPKSNLNNAEEISNNSTVAATEKVLAESEEKYRTLFNCNRDSITIFKFKNGKPTNFIEANPASTEIFGYSKEEFLSLTIRDLEFITPEIRKKRLEELKSTGKVNFETVLRTKNGKFRNVEIELLIINYSNESAVMCITHDITERKQLEINAAKAHENLATILEAIPDLLFEIDSKGIIHHYQSHRNDLLLFNPIDFLDKKIQNILPNNASKIIFASIKEASKKGWSTGYQYSLDIKNEKYWFELSVSLIKGTDSHNKHFIALAQDITSRKRAENKQIESLKFLEKITSRSPAVLYQFQLFPDGRSCFPYVSEGIRKVYDLNPEDITEDSSLIIDNIHSDDRPKILLSIEESAKNLTLWQQEFRIIVNNKLKNIRGTSSPQLEKDGSVVWYGFLTDITENKIAEQSLRESEEKYRSLVENSPDAIIIYIEEKIVFANQEAIRLSKVKNENEILGKSILDFVHPNSKDSIMKRMSEVVQNNDTSNIIEEKLIDINGMPINVELKGIPTIYQHQEAVQLIIHNITNRKRAQQKIKQLSLAVEQSPVSIIITNTLGEIEYVNPKFSENTGYSFEEIIGKNPSILKSNHTTKKEYKKLWDTIISGKEWHGEFQNVKKNGELFWESASISPITNEEGKTTHYISIKENITERKAVEKQLIEAKEKAEESDRLKSAFLANMSHEIRTPMNGILGFTELLKSKKLENSEQQEYIKIIEKSGVRMLNIINDIISISKVESGQLEVFFSETNLNEQIQYINTFFKPEATQKGITLLIKNSLPSSDAVIYTDPEKIYAILTNLVKNALKFTDSGSIEFGYTKKENHLEFFVKDTGLGITISQQKIIFERFRQANDTVSRSHEGSGLGLAISKAYVEILGGKIWLESTEGKGSTFYFTIPYERKIEALPKILSKKETKEQKLEKIKKLKVLIVEDDEISKLLITIALKPFSKEILKVSTGIEAIAACRNNPDIDLVMMDINMPEMGGYEATQEIRKFNNELIIIAQTANGMQSDRDESISVGCTDYISKPVNITTLGALIQKHFKK